MKLVLIITGLLFPWILPVLTTRTVSKSAMAIRPPACKRLPQKKPDRYENKRLTLRDRALTKGLDVTLTVNDLRDKLQQTQGYCPITGNPFTFAEHNATDWSVDRVDNTRGYCLDNIEIVSVIANQAKSDLDLSGIIKQALGKTKTDSLLTDTLIIQSPSLTKRG